ncbi:MAG: hypothetical protein QOH06_4556 [Acidobacteriota bacterium]|jgi:hypothetical protein|nr:hypothetical protein [Acidobacteriota bacterium]
MVVGITGHQNLDDESAWIWVADALRSALSEVPRPLIGISSLAIGADQLFAELILAQGGALRAVLPFPDYNETFESEAHRDRYQALLTQATHVEVLPTRETKQESYLAAGIHIVDISDRMLAVWDGKRAAGLGGTGDVVLYVRRIGKPLLHIDPTRRETKSL